MNSFTYGLIQFIKKNEFIASPIYRIYLQCIFLYRSVRSILITLCIKWIRGLVIRSVIEKLIITADETNLEYYGQVFHWNPSDRDSLLGIVHIGAYEQDELELMLRFIHKAMIVFDIGANYGLHTVIFADKVGENGHVYSFEPVKNIVGQLKKNIALNSYKDIVTVENLGLSNKKGTATIYISKALGTGATSLRKRWKGKNITQSCKLLTLDEYMLENKVSSIDFIKCDIEGGEYLVFQGAKKMLLKYKPALFFEAIDNHVKLFNYTLKEEVKYLESLSYTLFRVDGLNLLRNHEYKNGNYFAFSPKHIKQYKL